MEFQELETIIGSYLTLADKGIVKLLCATVIANRIAQLDPTWLFVVSSSSGGKSELLLALSYARGLMQKDDLTARTFISGAKSGDGTKTSLLDKLENDAIMVVKDLTVLLKKDSRESDAIFSQLRMIYDGSFSKSFGTGEDIDIPVRMGLIAGVTSEIEDHQADEAAVGQRAVKYYMKQPPDEEIDAVTAEVLNGKKDKQMRTVLGEAFLKYLDHNDWNSSAIPELPLELRQDIAILSNMATKARSSIKRKQFSQNNPIVRKNLREMPFRFAKQLANLARAMMIMNRGGLTGLDQNILYQIAMDSIPSLRKEVMFICTESESVTLEGLAQKMKLMTESAKVPLEDLIALDIVERRKVYGDKFQYFLRSNIRQTISKFENIPMSNQVLEEVEEIAPIPEETRASAAELNNLFEAQLI